MYIYVYIYNYIYIFCSCDSLPNSHSPTPAGAQEDVCGFAWAFATQNGTAVTFDAIARYAERRGTLGGRGKGFLY